MKRLPIWEGMAQLETALVELERRVEALERGVPADMDVPLIMGTLEMYPNQRICKWGDGHVTLTNLEWRIVWHLAYHPGYLRSRDSLLDLLIDDGDRDYRTIDSHIKRIRRKFEKVDPDFSEIVTVYGSGYKWRHPNGY